MTTHTREPITQEEADEIVSRRLTELERENKSLRDRFEARGCIVDSGSAISLLRVVVHGEIGKATDQVRKRRAVNSLAALDGIADFLGIH